MYEEWNRLIHSDQNGKVAGAYVPDSYVHYPEVHPVESRQLRVARYVPSLGIGDLLYCLTGVSRTRKCARAGRRAEAA
jgi:hypothetical protein